MLARPSGIKERFLELIAQGNEKALKLLEFLGLSEYFTYMNDRIFIYFIPSDLDSGLRLSLLSNLVFLSLLLYPLTVGGYSSNLRFFGSLLPSATTLRTGAALMWYDLVLYGVGNWSLGCIVVSVVYTLAVITLLAIGGTMQTFFPLTLKRLLSFMVDHYKVIGLAVILSMGWTLEMTRELSTYLYLRLERDYRHRCARQQGVLKTFLENRVIPLDYACMLKNLRAYESWVLTMNTPLDVTFWGLGATLLASLRDSTSFSGEKTFETLKKTLSPLFSEDCYGNISYLFRSYPNGLLCALGLVAILFSKLLFIYVDRECGQLHAQKDTFQEIPEKPFVFKTLAMLLIIPITFVIEYYFMIPILSLQLKTNH